MIGDIARELKKLKTEINKPGYVYPPEEEDDFLTEITPAEDERAFTISPLDEGEWRVEGIAIERTAKMTNWDYYEASLRFQRILDAMGVSEALREAGVEDEDVIHIGDIELVWGYENAFDD